MKGVNDIPGEVWQVVAIIYAGQPVGTIVYKHCQDVIDKYPEHFPWEHAYKKVPEEVHEAYRKEMGTDMESFLRKMPKFDDEVKTGGGIFQAMEEHRKKAQEQYETNLKRPLNEVFKEMWDEMGKREDEARLAVINHKRVWDKHYKKYKLSFIPNHYERKYLG